LPAERDASFWYFRPDEGESYDDLESAITEFAAKMPRRFGDRVAWWHCCALCECSSRTSEPADAVNWFPPQDVVLHFAGGRCDDLSAGANWDDAAIAPAGSIDAPGGRA
jgi:hypothetical protein